MAMPKCPVETGASSVSLSGLTPHEYICKIWTSEPDRFILDPIDAGTEHLAQARGGVGVHSRRTGCGRRTRLGQVEAQPDLLDPCRDRVRGIEESHVEPARAEALEGHGLADGRGQRFPRARREIGRAHV